MENYSPTKKETKQYIYEHNIIEQRHTYLQTIKKLRRENKTIIYTDETWVNAHHTQEYILVDSDGRDGRGGWKGWMEGERSKTNSYSCWWSGGLGFWC